MEITIILPQANFQSSILLKGLEHQWNVQHLQMALLHLSQLVPIKLLHPLDALIMQTLILNINLGVIVFLTYFFKKLGDIVHMSMDGYPHT
jgi:hypothetical protein